MKAIILMLVLVVFVSLPSAEACSCAFATPEEYIESADAIFRGVVVDVDRVGGVFSRDLSEAELKVSSYWKGGYDNKAVTVRSSYSSAACGFVFEEGEEYIVLSHRGDESYWVNSCGGTRMISGNQEYLDITLEDYLEVLEDKGLRARDPVAPDNPGDEVLSNILAVSGIALIIVLIGVWLGHRY